MHELNEQKWANAFVAYGLDAATGRLFRGLAHNINGVAQAFSMQTELLQMLFAQAAGLLDQGENATTLDEAREVCLKLKVMLERRAALVVHLEREVKVIQAIMQRCSGLVAATENAAIGTEFSLRAVLETELEFMNGDGFFKHQVNKELNVAAELPLLHGYLVEIHQILAILLENAVQSLQAAFSAGSVSPCLEISAAVATNQILLTISDNGAGIEPESQTRIFEPFYSTRPGRLGMGLFLARKMAERFAGAISCTSVPDCTAFTLAIPRQGDDDAAC